MSEPATRDLLAEVGLPSAKLWRVAVSGPSRLAVFLTYACSSEDVRKRLSGNEPCSVEEVPGELVSLGSLDRKVQEALS